MLKIRVETKNSAFEREENLEGCECARILREVARRLEENGERRGLIFDVNGNRVGGWRLSKR